MSAPWSFEQAQQAARLSTQLQRHAEKELRDRSRDAAIAEEAYRVLLAKAIVEAHAGGVAWSVASDVARGRPDVAKLRMHRDIAEGVREATVQAAWRAAADRRDTQSFLTWSMRADLRDDQAEPPNPLPAIGSRRAA